MPQPGAPLARPVTCNLGGGSRTKAGSYSEDMCDTRIRQVVRYPTEIPATTQRELSSTALRAGLGQQPVGHQFLLGYAWGYAAIGIPAISKSWDTLRVR